MTLVTCGMERCLGCLLPSGDGTTCFLCPHLAQSLSLAHTRAEDITPPPHYNNIALHGGGGGKSLDLGRGQM